MRLAYLTNQYPKVSHTFIRREIAALERRGHEIVRFSVRPTHEALSDPADLREQKRTTVIVGQPLLRILAAVFKLAFKHPIRLANALGRAITMGRASERGVLRHLAYVVEAAFVVDESARQGIRHIHVHFGTNATTVAYFVERLGGPTYSFTVHGPSEFDAPAGFHLGEKIRHAAFVVGISNYCVSQLRRWCGPADWQKIHIVRCGVDPAFFAKSTPLDDASHTFVSVGRLTPQKGQLVLIEAFAEIAAQDPQARLILVGDGELREVIEARIQTLGLESRVTITGWASEEQVRDALANCRALVLPSFAEGLPVVIMEAFALARPVITTWIAGIPELVRPGENGWLMRPADVAALASAMQEALDCPPERLQTMAKAGQARVREAHDVDAEAERLEELLQRQLRRSA